MTGRLVFVLALAGSWLLAATVRLYQLQVVHHDDYARRAERQQQRVVVLDPPRGTIYDARGRELAVSLEIESVGVDPSVEGVDAAATVAALDRVLHFSPERRKRLAAEMAEPEREFAWVARKLDPPLADAVRALDLPGLVFLAESKRYYPLRSLAAQVLGYVGTDRAGLAGVEFLFDRVVASEPGRRTVFRDAKLDTLLHPGLAGAAPRPGDDLRLTLDAAIQHVVERELAAAVERHHAKRGTVVVMEPKSGAILAMASYPSFDPNRYGASPEEHRRNPAIMDAYEPGSTFKMVTLAAALEASAYSPDEILDCGMGGITLGGVRINDHKKFGLLTVRQVIAKSSNVGAIRLGLGAGRQRLYDTIVAFGFGRPTGIDLPSESPGILRAFDRWSPITPAYLSFGQGLSVTPLQLTVAFAAVANGGRLPRPHVVAALGDRPLGPRLPTPLALAPSTLTELRRILAEVVSVDGTAKAAMIPGYAAAGKTGTAQKAVAGGYAANRFIASFVGFAPLDDPELVATVVLDEPWPAYHGGDVAAPAWKRIVEQVLLYLGRTPEREAPERWPGEPSRPPREAAEPISGFALASLPAPEAAPPDEPPAGTVPRFTGLTAREAVQRASGLGLRLALDGHGVVVGQIPEPGTPLEAAGGILRLALDTVTM